MGCHSDNGVTNTAEVYVAAGSPRSQVLETRLRGKRISYTLACLSKSKDVDRKITSSIFLEYKGQ